MNLGEGSRKKGGKERGTKTEQPRPPTSYSQKNAAEETRAEGPRNYMVSVVFFLPFFFFSVVVFLSSCLGAAKEIVPRANAEAEGGNHELFSFEVLSFCWVRR